ncbi:MAG: hypothetical protein CMJ75_18825 [Planctomycetaceae bacterium]|nr:hypothetical protein [Planctomycetaceae bacterium]
MSLIGRKFVHGGDEFEATDDFTNVKGRRVLRVHAKVRIGGKLHETDRVHSPDWFEKTFMRYAGTREVTK